MPRKREDEDSIIAATGKKVGVEGGLDPMVLSNYWLGKHNDV